MTTIRASWQRRLPTIAALLTVLALGLACGDDDTDGPDQDDDVADDDTTYDPGDPYGLAAFAGTDRWVHAGDEVVLVGHDSGDVSWRAWDLDGDGACETEVGRAEAVSICLDVEDEAVLTYCVEDADGVVVEDRLSVVAFSPDTTMWVTTFGPYVDHELPPPAKARLARGMFADAWNHDHYTFLPQEQQQRLDDDGFATAETGNTQIYAIYDQLDEYSGDEFPYITLDSMLHAFHVLYDYSLRAAEDAYLTVELQALAVAMVDHFYRLHEAGPSGELAAAIELDMAYYAVLATLLDPAFAAPAPVAPQVAAEVAQIEAAVDKLESQLWVGIEEDYTQYRPRGHYDRTETLSRYFRAMMYAGRMTFHLAYPERDQQNREETLAALLQVQALRVVAADQALALQRWDALYEPTAFFVGKMDELTQHEYAELAEDVYGDDPTQLTVEQLADATLLEEFMERAIDELRDPQITSELMPPDMAMFENDIAKGYRFMGQRYVPDSYIFEELVYTSVGTKYEPREMPIGLDIWAVMGSDRAWELLDQYYGETQYLDYEAQHVALADQFAQIPEAEWTQSVYWGWMYALLPTLDPQTNGYDQLGRSVEWIDRMLNSAHGSWAELRHDTVLYAEQSYTDDDTCDDDTGPPGPPVEFSGYVDPVPQTWARLASLSQMLRTGLISRGLEEPSIVDQLQRLESRCLLFRDIADAEIAGTPLTTGQQAVFSGYGEWLAGVTVVDLPHLSDPAVDEDMAVIADVHSDPDEHDPGEIPEVLEVGVGHPLRLYVLVDVQGTTFVTEGGIFSYHEFPWPMEDRLTDEEWQDMVATGTAPDPPAWIF